MAIIKNKCKYDVRKKCIVENGFTNTPSDSRDLLIGHNGKNFLIQLGEEIELPVEIITSLNERIETQWVKKKRKDDNGNDMEYYVPIERKRFRVMELGDAEKKEIDNRPDYIKQLDEMKKVDLCDIYTELGGEKNPKRMKTSDLKKSIIELDKNTRNLEDEE